MTEFMDSWIDLIEDTEQDIVRKELKKAKSTDDKIKVLYHHHPTGQISLEPIKFLEDYLKCIRLTSGTNWFRGQSREFDTLTPKLFRNKNKDDINTLLAKEKKSFLEFRRRSRAFINSINENDLWTWYFLMQHYGGQTRLLDWTTNAGVALFMALDFERESQENPIVYVLNPLVLSRYAYNELGKDDSKPTAILYPGEQPTNKWLTNIESDNNKVPESPIALLPAYSDQRIISQHSCFTLFGSDKTGFVKNEKEITCPCCSSKVIHRIVIDGKHKESLRKELKIMGISSETVYPGLDGLNKEIIQEIFT